MDFIGGKLSEPDIFRAVFERNEVSRSALAEIFSRVSPSTLYRLLGQLVKKGYLEESSGQGATNGRPPKLYRINPASALAVGVSITWDRIGIALSDIGGTLYGTRYLKGAASMTPREAVSRLTAEIADLIAEDGDSRNIVGIGVAAFGPILKDRGILSHGFHKLSSAWDDVPLKDMLESGTKLPVCVDNLVEACLLNELGTRTDLRLKKVAYVLLDKGIGSALYAQGEKPSRHDTSGQVGHMTIDFDGAPCVCGRVGCLETFAAADALANRLSVDFEGPSDGDVYEWLSTIDARIPAVIGAPSVDDISDAIAAALRNFASLRGPEAILLGGRTVSSVPSLVDLAISKFFASSDRLFDTADISIEKVSLDDTGYLRGAALLMLRSRYGILS